MIAVVATHVVSVLAGRCRSIDGDRLYHPFSSGRSLVQSTLALDSVSVIVFVCFSRIKILLGRTESRTREKMDRQSIRIV